MGACSRIAAGSVVLHPVPPNTTMAGVPARAVGTAGCAEPSRSMNQILSQLAYDSFTYTITASLALPLRILWNSRKLFG